MVFVLCFSSWRFDSGLGERMEYEQSLLEHRLPEPLLLPLLHYYYYYQNHYRPVSNDNGWRTCNNYETGGDCEICGGCGIGDGCCDVLITNLIESDVYFCVVGSAIRACSSGSVGASDFAALFTWPHSRELGAILTTAHSRWASVLCLATLSRGHPSFLEYEKICWIWCFYD